MFVNSCLGEIQAGALNYGHSGAEWKKYFENFLQSSWALPTEWKEFDLALISLFFLLLAPDSWTMRRTLYCLLQLRVLISVNDISAANSHPDFPQAIVCGKPSSSRDWGALCSFQTVSTRVTGSITKQRSHLTEHLAASWVSKPRACGPHMEGAPSTPALWSSFRLHGLQKDFHHPSYNWQACFNCVCFQPRECYLTSAAAFLMLEFSTPAQELGQGLFSLHLSSSSFCLHPAVFDKTLKLEVISRSSKIRKQSKCASRQVSVESGNILIIRR